MASWLSRWTIVATGLLAASSFAYPQNTGPDLVFDAPWRTMRDDLPLLVFIPDAGSSLTGFRLEEIAFYNVDSRRNGRSDERHLIFRDRAAPNSRSSSKKEYLNCKTPRGSAPVRFVDPDGRGRGGVVETEPIEHFWHYIARLPVACVGFAGQLGRTGRHLIEAEMVYSLLVTPQGHPAGSPRRSQDPVPQQRVQQFVRKVLKVHVDPRPLARFDARDQYFDVHYHTIAEQTKRKSGFGADDVFVGSERDREVDVARKVFGGPLAMVVESAYALGLIDVQLDDGNWKDFHNRIATTDHNTFYSTEPSDSPSAPGYGPTAGTDGHLGEFRWYREHFGALAGEEIALKDFRSERFEREATERRGHHYLFYDGEHFEGPWHGGRIKIEASGFSGTSKISNGNSLAHVHKHGGPSAFGYAAHPYAAADGWPPELLDVAVGTPPFNDFASPALIGPNQKDFVFKGLQVWNEDNVWVSDRLRAGEAHDIDQAHSIDPFTGRKREQVEVINLFRGQDLKRGMSIFEKLVQRGLSYTFKQRPTERFIRKLYASAGTDAHGDFNYTVSSSALISSSAGNLLDLPGISHVFGTSGTDNHMRITGNAFGRVRTYSLTSERMSGDAIVAGSRAGMMVLASKIRRPQKAGNLHATLVLPSTVESANAYREGNTILTNGPICRLAVDTNCRWNSGTAAWHDASCAFENLDGRIGGRGHFDGGFTGLYVKGDRRQIWQRWEWEDPINFISDVDSNRITFQVSHISPSAIRRVEWVDKRKGQSTTQPLLIDVADESQPSALMLQGQPRGENRNGVPVSTGTCTTNPIWLQPVEIAIEHPDRCPMAPGSLRVTAAFSASMAGDENVKVRVAPLNGQGFATSPLPLRGELAWRDVGGVGNSLLTVHNEQEIPCPSEGWNARAHKPTSKVVQGMRGAHSWVVSVDQLRDVHGNRLNSIAKTLTMVHGITHGTGTTGTIGGASGSGAGPGSPKKAGAPKKRTFPALKLPIRKR